MNEMVLMGFAAVLALLVITLIILVMNLNKPASKKSGSSQHYESRQLLNIHAFDLPPGVEKIPREAMFGAVRSIYKVFHSLDYPHANIADYNKQQWHSWQVAILLRFYKMDFDFHIDNPKEVFLPDVLNLKDKDLRYILNDIMVRFKRDVELDRTRDFLSRDIRWTGRDIAVLFSFLTKYKELAL